MLNCVCCSEMLRHDVCVNRNGARSLARRARGAGVRWRQARWRCRRRRWSSGARRWRRRTRSPSRSPTPPTPPCTWPPWPAPRLTSTPPSSSLRYKYNNTKEDVALFPTIIHDIWRVSVMWSRLDSCVMKVCGPHSI